MSSINANAALARSIRKVLSRQSATSVTLSLKLTSPSNTAWSWTAIFLDRLTVIQDFRKSYGDDITCDVKISPRAALKLHENMDDLTASLTMIFLGPDGDKKTLDVQPITKKYRVMVVGAQDLRRMIQGADGRVEDTMSITLRLVDPLLYDVRQREFSGTFSNTTVESAIRYIATSFGITTLHFAPPDNTHVYDHLIIPPSKGFGEVWSYIQDRYGVYLKGLSAYITDGAFYIYPPYEHQSQYSKQAHFYLDDKGGNAGLPCYHSVSDGVVEVVLDGGAEATDLSQMGGENVGTGFTFSRSNQILDGYVETNENGSKFTNSSSMSISMGNAKTAGADRFNIKQAPFASDNIFVMSSALIRYQAEIVQADWRMAAMGLLVPGHAIKYLYDDGGTMASSYGILEAVGYDLLRAGPIGDSQSSYNTRGRVRFRIDPDHA